ANQGGFSQDIPSKSNRITQAQKNLITSLSKGQKVYFLDIKAVGPDGGVRELLPIVFKIN
ncbi:MAG TPA: GldM family protein, partial [Bacteroidales bacterium]|nr:GldM family protein [Bacteroidales bacterium]